MPRRIHILRRLPIDLNGTQERTPERNRTSPPLLNRQEGNRRQVRYRALNRLLPRTHSEPRRRGGGSHAGSNREIRRKEQVLIPQAPERAHVNQQGIPLPDGQREMQTHEEIPRSRKSDGNAGVKSGFFHSFYLTREIIKVECSRSLPDNPLEYGTLDNQGRQGGLRTQRLRMRRIRSARRFRTNGTRRQDFHRLTTSPRTPQGGRNPAAKTRQIPPAGTQTPRVRTAHPGKGNRPPLGDIRTSRNRRRMNRRVLRRKTP